MTQQKQKRQMISASPNYKDGTYTITFEDGGHIRIKYSDTGVEIINPSKLELALEELKNDEEKREIVSRPNNKSNSTK